MLKIYDLKNKQEYINEVAILTQKEWGQKNLSKESFELKVKNKARKRNISKLYLKTDLENYYEKFGAIYLDTLSNGEKIYYFIIKTAFSK